MSPELGKENGLSRRSLLAGAAALSSISFVGTASTGSAQTQLFSLGVASGDPHADSIVLWTRLAPDPNNGGGMGERDVEVAWELATDENFAEIAQSGTVSAAAASAHSVRVIPESLAPSTTYHYRFRAEGESSPVGRTRTAPAPGAAPGLLRFAVGSCANWEHGHYAAYRDIADQDLDFVLFLGDYIYEYGQQTWIPASLEKPVRLHDGPEADSLLGYRNRHALHKSDPYLQAAHANCPWIVTWDDHEVVNDYQDGVGPTGADASTFLERRAHAYQAYYEHLPLPPSSRPDEAGAQIYRQLQFGDLADLHVLDTRQFRTPHPCGQGVQERCDESFGHSVSLLGNDQESWLLAGLESSTAQWNLIAQQVMMSEFEISLPGLGERYNLDQWDGYPTSRSRILDSIDNLDLDNVAVFSGDVHSAWIADLKTDFKDPTARTIATEIVSTSITSANDLGPLLGLARINNPHLLWLDIEHGYSLCELDANELRIDFRGVRDVTDPDSQVETVGRFVLHSGRAGAEPR